MTLFAPTPRTGLIIVAFTCLFSLALIVAGCIAAKSVWPDDINPRKEYRMQLIENSMRAHGLEVPR
jgi:hypothetical protein